MSTAGSGAGPTTAEIVRTAARAFERDRYLSALLAPRQVRDDLVALAAFAGEIGRIPALVSEPMLGEIRLQWWRDALAVGLGGDGGARGHPVADAVVAALRRAGVGFEAVEPIIEAMVQRLGDCPFSDLAALEHHLGQWDGGLFVLAWRMLGGKGEAPDVLAQAGEVYGLARCLVEAPAELAQGRILLPMDLVSACGISLERARTREAAPQWRELNARLADSAMRRANDVIGSYQGADVQVRAAALPLALFRPYLRASERADMASLVAADVAPLTRVWRLWRTSRTGRI